jgi:hypothetical protein
VFQSTCIYVHTKSTTLSPLINSPVLYNYYHKRLFQIDAAYSPLLLSPFPLCLLLFLLPAILPLSSYLPLSNKTMSEVKQQSNRPKPNPSARTCDNCRKRKVSQYTGRVLSEEIEGLILIPRSNVSKIRIDH